MNELYNNPKKLVRKVGIYELALYDGRIDGSRNEEVRSVVRAWRMGHYPSIIRSEPYSSWQLYEGDYDTAKMLFEGLKDEYEVERLLEPRLRNMILSRREEIEEFREEYGV